VGYYWAKFVTGFSLNCMTRFGVFDVFSGHSFGWFRLVPPFRTVNIVIIAEY